MNFALLLLISCQAWEARAALSPGAPDQETQEEFSGAISDDLSRFGSRLGQRFSDVLFDHVSDFTILRGDTGGFRYKVDARRRIFDNHDLANTWTVADNIRISASIPLFTEESDINVLGADFFNFSFGTHLGLELLNIRQITVPRSHGLEKITELKARVESSDWLKSVKKEDAKLPAESLPPALENGEEERDLLTPTGKSGPQPEATLAFFDPLRRARYGQFWKLLAFPVQLPLTVKRLEKLQNYEIMSYNLSGSVQVGASVGWNLPLDQVFNSVTGEVSYSVYLRGDFRISIMKEDERYARIKITRSRTHGKSAGLNSRTDRAEYFEGAVVLNDRSLLGSTYLVPFRLRMDESTSQAFDVGYRYDLSQPEARKAYELAALGRFAYSDELAGGLQGSPEARPDSPVRKIFTRNQKIDTRAFSMGVAVSRIVKHGRGSTTSDWEAVVSLPDGTRRIVTSETRNSDEWKAFWGIYERIHHVFRVNVDLDLYRDGQLGNAARDALYLVIEGSIEDSDTRGKEMRKYIRSVEGAVGERDLFPLLPVNRPLKPEEAEQYRAAANENAALAPDLGVNYGYSTFYYRMTFGQDQVERFVRTPREKMWSALEKAFGEKPGTWSTLASRLRYDLAHAPQSLLNIPLYLFNLRIEDSTKLFHARALLKHWLWTQQAVDIRDTAERLGELFRDSVYNEELVRLVKTVLEGEKVAYVVTGSNSAFGRVWKQGEHVVDFYPLPDRINRDIDFDREDSRSFGDDSSRVDGIFLTPNGADSYELGFSATQKPWAIFVRLSEKTTWGQNTVAEFVVSNTENEFQSGPNRVAVSPEGKEPWAALARALQKNRNYELGLAITKDGQIWGPLNTARIKAH
ncbi:MAG: hypothetical protein NDJ89_12505 [Oligoflexia bacterium]|nr:hypothetical protein [Oligoflexia bacterium]